MKPPIIFCIDDDPQVLNAIDRDLRHQFRKDYRILKASSGQQALDALKQLKLRNEVVALFLSDQKMPEMEGVDFLEKAREIFPEAKRVLLTAYADTSAAIKAINDVKLDYYLMKPWDPPEEKLYPVIEGILGDWQVGFKPAFTGIKIIGFQWSPKSHRIKDLLAGYLIPYLWMDIETSKEAEALLSNTSFSKSDLPVIIFEDGSTFSNPKIPEIASKIGLNTKASDQLYDVVIIGAGPSGLAASVYGASEGLKTLLIERHTPGGQAGTSSKIENYLGFPSGLSGAELTKRAMTQASRFGTEFLSSQEVTCIKVKDNYKTLQLSDQSEIKAKAVVITTGVSYRTLDVPGIESLTGAGVYYGAASIEALSCKNEDVYIIGGGNSAGQAAMYLSKFARSVFIIIRGESLSASMSSYLIEQIKGTPCIEILPFSQVVEVNGKDRLDGITLLNTKTNERRQEATKALFVFIGAKPSTDWTGQDIIKDERNFIVTGRELLKFPEFEQAWKPDREPFLLETSIPGIFASGDVRSGAMARVASAVGEGSMAIKFVHEYLAEH